MSRTSYRGTGLLCIKAEQGVYSTLMVKPSVGVKSGEEVFTMGFPNVGLQGFERAKNCQIGKMLIV